MESLIGGLGAMDARLIGISFFVMSMPAWGQSTSPTAQTTLDPAPWVSPRASSMGGALSTSADNMDAMYYNPAGIGGQIYGGKPDKTALVQQVIFPRLGMTMNDNASKLNDEFSSKANVSMRVDLLCQSGYF